MMTVIATVLLLIPVAAWELDRRIWLPAHRELRAKRALQRVRDCRAARKAALESVMTRGLDPFEIRTLGYLDGVERREWERM